jgi:hypothetical protein
MTMQHDYNLQAFEQKQSAAFKEIDPSIWNDNFCVLMRGNNSHLSVRPMNSIMGKNSKRTVTANEKRVHRRNGKKFNKSHGCELTNERIVGVILESPKIVIYPQ